MMKIRYSGCAHALLPTCTNALTVCYASRCHYPLSFLCPTWPRFNTFSLVMPFLPQTPGSPHHTTLQPLNQAAPPLSLSSPAPDSAPKHTILPLHSRVRLPLASDHNTLPPPQTSLPSLTCLISYPATPSQTPIAMAPPVPSPKTALSPSPSAQARLPPRPLQPPSTAGQAAPFALVPTQKQGQAPPSLTALLPLSSRARPPSGRAAAHAHAHIHTHPPGTGCRRCGGTLPGRSG